MYPNPNDPQNNVPLNNPQNNYNPQQIPPVNNLPTQVQLNPQGVNPINVPLDPNVPQINQMNVPPQNYPAPNYADPNINYPNPNQVYPNANPNPNFQNVNPDPNYPNAMPGQYPNVNPGLSNYQNIQPYAQPYPQGTYQPPQYYGNIHNKLLKLLL